MVESSIVNEAMVAQFKNPDDEDVMFEAKISKLSRWNISQERIWVQTTEHFYVFKGKKLNRKHRITNINAIIKSLVSDEVVFHFPQSKDLRMTCKQKDDLINTLLLRYSNLSPETTLRIYAVPDKSLKSYSHDNKNYSYENLPDESYRVIDKEIKGTEVQKPSDEIDFRDPENRFSMAKQKRPNMDGGDDFVKSESDVDNIKSFSRSSTLMKSKASLKGQKEPELADFQIINQLGRGTFGRVYLAEWMGKKYAIKAIRKDVLIEYDQVKNTKLERDIMFECDHVNLVSMDYLFQNESRLYFVMPFVRGGELYKIFQTQKRFQEQTVKFYAAQIALAIGELHSKGIAHRDLKLENILIDERGFLKVIDYGLAKTLGEGETTTSFCGTPEYLAPEMVTHAGHDFRVDWWALGVLIYEMTIGVTPFYNRNRQVLVSKIKNSKVVFPDRTKYKVDYTDDLMDLVTQLLKKDKDDRLGKDGVNEVIKHPFFADLDFDALEDQTMIPPFVPEVGGGKDGVNAAYFNVKTSA